MTRQKSTPAELDVVRLAKALYRVGLLPWATASSAIAFAEAVAREYKKAAA